MNDLEIQDIRYSVRTAKNMLIFVYQYGHSNTWIVEFPGIAQHVIGHDKQPRIFDWEKAIKLSAKRLNIEL